MDKGSHVDELLHTYVKEGRNVLGGKKVSKYFNIKRLQDSEGHQESNRDKCAQSGTFNYKGTKGIICFHQRKQTDD